MNRFWIWIGLVLLLAVTASAPPQRQMENLTRGIVAVKQPGGISAVHDKKFEFVLEALAPAA